MLRTRPGRRSLARRAFTLVEMIVASGISGFTMVGVLSSFVLIGQNSYNAANYSIMESEARRALEMFTQEARMADNLTWNNANSVTLSVVGASGSSLVTYAYDSATSGSTAQCFYRKTGNATSTATPLILLRNVSEFAFRRYKVINGTDYSATNDLDTKQLQIALRTIRTGVTTVKATNAVLSARVVLRNKPVST